MVERRLGRRRRRVRRRRARRRSRPRRTATADRSGRQLRHGDAERAAACRSDARAHPATDRRRTCSASKTAGLLTRVGDMYARSVHRRVARLRSGAHRLRLHASRCGPGETGALMTFVVKGLSEIYDPRGGFPIPIRDGSSRRRRRRLRRRGRRVIPAAGIARSRAVTDDRAPARRRARPARPHAAAALADR